MLSLTQILKKWSPSSSRREVWALGGIVSWRAWVIKLTIIMPRSWRIYRINMIKRIRRLRTTWRGKENRPWILHLISSYHSRWSKVKLYKKPMRISSQRRQILWVPVMKVLWWFKTLWAPIHLFTLWEILRSNFSMSSWRAPRKNKMLRRNQHLARKLKISKNKAQKWRQNLFKANKLNKSQFPNLTKNQ